MTDATLRDRIRGSLVAGAIGDALGYPVEFMSLSAIRRAYGPDGITRFDTSPRWTDLNHKAVFSDDTQMTLFTAEGVLNAHRSGSNHLDAIRMAYLEWLTTQSGNRSPRPSHGSLSDVPALNVRRAPGITCLTALQSIWHDHEPDNNSKGCGGVMRIAPIALLAAAGHLDVQQASLLAADAAKLTHLHPLGYIPAALMAHVLYHLATADAPSRPLLIEAIEKGNAAVEALFHLVPEHAAVMTRLARQAIARAGNQLSDTDNIAALGEGWVGEEALAIALYCAVRHFDNLEQALIAAVNHSGDSDSTGAIAGNLLGAATGFEAIPEHFKQGIEQLDLLVSIADQLAQTDHN